MELFQGLDEELKIRDTFSEVDGTIMPASSCR
jgi:hypothetical protein